MDKSLGIIEINIDKTLPDYFETIGVLTDISSLFTDKELAELSRIVTGTKIPFFHIRLKEDNGEGGVIECHGFLHEGLYGYEFTTIEDMNERVYQIALYFQLGSVQISSIRLSN